MLISFIGLICLFRISCSVDILQPIAIPDHQPHHADVHLDPPPHCVWCNAVADEKTLIHEIYTASRLIDSIGYINGDTVEVQNISLTIRGHVVAHLFPDPLYSSVHSGITLLQLFSQWYQHNALWDKQIFQLDSEKIDNLLYFIRTVQPGTQKWNTFMTIKKELKSIFGRHTEKFFLFFKWIYVEPYTSWISGGRLQFIETIGVGTQARVYQAMDLYDGTLCAVKAFIEGQVHDCYREEQIMTQITKHASAIQVPQIISRYNCSCVAHGAIIMDLVPGETVYALSGNLTQQHYADMHEQVGRTIKQLAFIGIGHFDINPLNIMMDGKGIFWLIDFGLGFMISPDGNVQGNLYPIIGTWQYYSPTAYDLNNMFDVVLKDRGVITNYTMILWEIMIHNANLYSLQSVMLHLTGYDKMQVEYRYYVEQCREMWNESTKKKITTGLVKYLVKVWNLRQRMARQYLNDTCDVCDKIHKQHLSMILTPSVRQQTEQRIIRSIDT
eukprot:194341_1